MHTPETCECGSGWVTNGRVCGTAAHLWTVCVLCSLLHCRNAICQVSDWAGSNRAIHPVSLPQQRNACFPLKAPKLTTFHGSPAACTIRSTPGPGIWTFLQWDPAIPSKPPPLRVQSLRQAAIPNTAFTLEPTLPGRATRYHQGTGNVLSQLSLHPWCPPSPGHTSSAVGNSPHLF